MLNNMIKRQVVFAIILFCFLPYKIGASEKLPDVAIFAMGCFWSAEIAFRDPNSNQLLPGIMAIKVGYAGGEMPNPTYDVHDGYKEAVKITFDPAIISYNKLLDLFWHDIDPFDRIGQFCDKGNTYTSVIYFMNENQKNQALASKERVQKQLNKEIITEIIPYTTFYDAEEYHQNFKAKNPERYSRYRFSCGRDKRIESIWVNVKHEN
jgi:peptide-methionine (S)-S-oxide reductase